MTDAPATAPRLPDAAPTAPAGHAPSPPHPLPPPRAPARSIPIDLTHAGRASLTVSHVAGQSSITSAYATHPMKLLTPRPRGTSVWTFTSSFGGGLVTGDHTQLDVQLLPHTRCFLGTQASTKIYRSPHRGPCSHSTTAEIGSDALLVFAPDPVQAFADAAFRQRQSFRLAPDASLVLVDALSAGRPARGERWAFRHFSSRNEIHVDDHLAFLDALRLDPDDGPLDTTGRLGRFDALALLVVIGDHVRDLAADLLATYASGTPRSRCRPDLLATASPLPGGAVLRLAGEEIESVLRILSRHLRTLAHLLCDDPWSRKG